MTETRGLLLRPCTMLRTAYVGPNWEDLIFSDTHAGEIIGDWPRYRLGPNDDRSRSAEGGVEHVVPLIGSSCLVVSALVRREIEAHGGSEVQFLPVEANDKTMWLLHPTRHCGQVDFECSDVDVIPGTKIVTEARSLFVVLEEPPPSVFRPCNYAHAGVMVSDEMAAKILPLAAKELSTISVTFQVV